MSIAIFDYDAISNPLRFRPNLEVMKMATYYKTVKDEITVLLLDARNHESYGKVIIRKDRPSDDFPFLLMREKNVEYGGEGFTNGFYSPMDREIENSRPDYHFYERFFSHFEGRIKASSIKKYKWEMNKNLLRLSTNGINCDIKDSNFRSLDKKGLLIFDRAVNLLGDSFETLSDLQQEFQTVYYRNPMQMRSMEECRKWIASPVVPRELSSTFMGYSIVNANFAATDEDIRELSELRVSTKKRITLLIGAGKTFETHEDYVNEFKRIMRHVIYNKAHKTHLPMYYDRVVFRKSLYEYMYWLLQDFSVSATHDMCMADHAPKRQNEGYLLKLLEETKSDPEVRELVYKEPWKIRLKGEKWDAYLK